MGTAQNGQSALVAGRQVRVNLLARSMLMTDRHALDIHRDLVTLGLFPGPPGSLHHRLSGRCSWRAASQLPCLPEGAGQTDSLQQALPSSPADCQMLPQVGL